LNVSPTDPSHTNDAADHRHFYYAYAAPEPAGLREARIRPAAASYDATLGEFVLDYDAVRRAPSPRETLLEFMQSTYDAAADLARWDRAALERAP